MKLIIFKCVLAFVFSQYGICTPLKDILILSSFQILLDSPRTPKDVAIIPECDANNLPESEAEVNSCSKHLLDPQLMSTEDAAIREVCYIGDVAESEAEVEVHSCSKPFMDPLLISKEYRGVTEACKDDVTEREAEVNSSSKLLLAPLHMPKEGAAVGIVCNTVDVPESEAEPSSCRKDFKAEKPRRLAPLMPKEGAAVARACNTVDIPESEAELSSCKKAFKAEKPRRLASVMPKEGAEVALVCNTIDVPESESELGSCRKDFKAEKKPRRLVGSKSFSYFMP